MRDRFMVSMQAIDDAAVSNAALGAWLRLHRYCAAKFNSGRIVGCRTWGKDAWLRHASLTRRDVEAVEACGMALWDGDDLVLKWYDLPGEKLYPAQSQGGKLGADRRWEKHRQAKALANEGANGSPIDSPNAQGQEHSSSDQISGGAEVSPREAPAAPSGDVTWESRAHAVLAAFALATDPKSLLEWMGHLQHVACTGGPNETKAYLRWATGVAQRRGLRLRYAREFEILGQEWNNGERDRQKRQPEAAPAQGAQA